MPMTERLRLLGVRGCGSPCRAGPWPRSRNSRRRTSRCGRPRCDPRRAIRRRGRRRRRRNPVPAAMSSKPAAPTIEENPHLASLSGAHRIAQINGGPAQPVPARPSLRRAIDSNQEWPPRRRGRSIQSFWGWTGAASMRRGRDSVRCRADIPRFRTQFRRSCVFSAAAAPPKSASCKPMGPAIRRPSRRTGGRATRRLPETDVQNIDVQSLDLDAEARRSRRRTRTTQPPRLSKLARRSFAATGSTRPRGRASIG